ncbi:uncharacterized protein EI90DRAFT_3279558 [Cantharellus anzutake]|uniref:uncharacterized protein n=1 Tax=Cantharellus anzutake TaxID=1750568 RepID=UPI0019032713|nr:uncharacterized protein EI90DRAFT_3279558 [Cantharellus anzutake]KAF8337945.1 hypothetical protein EI90DRAFT_3279558 [Cantharellus anzutake]
MAPSLRARLHHIVRFNSLNVTLLTVLVYLAIFITVEWQDVPKGPSKNTGDISFNEALFDLQAITSRPHPYNSHDNDRVRGYLLTRVQNITAGHDRAEVVDDLVSNATYGSASQIVYHESLNVLARIEGTAPALDGVLFSAHFDSVSTGYGATDDGMGVATLLQLLNVVFNINNGEEDWLNGAHVFLEHPFARRIATFLNLEGAGSGGRPLLFRSSNAKVTKAFKAAPHPHGNTISDDGFKRGLVRSGTDYSVYEASGMRGLDLAFYKPRSQYHTKWDSVSNLNGAASLWAMMESALATAHALANDASTTESDEPSVYFDVLGEALVVLTRNTAFIINLLILILGPIFVLILGAFTKAQGKLFLSWRGWMRFPVAFISTGTLVIGLSTLIIHFNPFIIYGSVRTVLWSLVAFAFLVHYGVLRTGERLRPVESQRLIILIELYVLWWFALLFDTVMLRSREIGALYPILFFHGGALLALLAGLLEALLLSRKTPQEDLPSDPDDPNAVTETLLERPENHENEHAEGLSERTPLLAEIRRKVVGLKSEQDEKEAGGLWISQYVLSIPFPVLFAAQTALFAMYSLHQTLADGAAPTTVYAFAAIFSIMMVLPLAPFIHRIHCKPILLLALFFVIITLYNILTFPFSSSAPFKVYFKQTLDIETNTNHVYLRGARRYLEHPVVDSIPSSHSQEVICEQSFVRLPLWSCRWSGIPPNVTQSGNKPFTFAAKRLSNRSEARFKIKGLNTRACRIYFDKPIKYVHVHGASQNGTLQQGYEPDPQGATIVKLWSRTWDKEFVADVGFGQDGAELRTGRVACEYSENLSERIPALEEIGVFLPEWAAVTKLDDGLVEAYHKFEV